MSELNQGPDVLTIEMLEPSLELMASQVGEWETHLPTAPLLEHITQNYWQQPISPLAWEVARISRAVYLYRETTTHWTVVVKYYAPKTGLAAEKYARRELEKIEEARSAGLEAGPVRAIQPLGAWRGVLFLEYVPGLTLADIIAVRRSQPGRLSTGLDSAAELLARLHLRGARSEPAPNFEPAAAETLEYVDELEERGVLKGEQLISDSLRHLIDQWLKKASMSRYTPSLTHGDATTTNFVYPEEEQMVGIDWERLSVADPASDLGRLAAEISYSVRQQAGSSSEIAHLLQRLFATYSRAWPVTGEAEALLERARFYQASSLLRIARNSWVSYLDRTALVTQAMALLALSAPA